MRQLVIEKNLDKFAIRKYFFAQEIYDYAEALLFNPKTVDNSFVAFNTKYKYIDI